MLSHSLRTNSDAMPSGRVRSFLPRNAVLRQHLPTKLPSLNLGAIVDHAVEIAPSDAVERRTRAWDGMVVEVVEAITHDKLEFRFRAPQRRRRRREDR